MRYIGYEELDPGNGFPKLSESIGVLHPRKQELINFLKSGEEDFVKMSYTKDIFSGIVIPFPDIMMHKGRFYWSSVLAWYVEKYDLQLPKDFEEYILMQE